MKALKWIPIIVFFVIIACTEEVKEIEISDLSEYNMKIIPAHPTSHDQIILVVYNDCTYNILSGINRDGQIIFIEKQFNSMMKWPCIMRNDTIEIGQLAEGDYTLNYKLIDISPQVSDPVALSFSYNLQVSK